ALAALTEAADQREGPESLRVPRDERRWLLHAASSGDPPVSAPVPVFREHSTGFRHRPGAAPGRRVRRPAGPACAGKGRYGEGPLGERPSTLRTGGCGSEAHLLA